MLELTFPEDKSYGKIEHTTVVGAQDTGLKIGDPASLTYHGD